MTSALFTKADDPRNENRDVRISMATASFGERVDHLGRYKMPLLPGERGPKAGGDWVPRGVQSATNLAGAIVESRQLGIWERRLSQVGLALRPPLAEQLATVVHKARAQGVDFLKLGSGATAEAKLLAATLDTIHNAAKDAAGGNDAARAGTIRHEVWEERARTSQLFGTPQINAQIIELEQLLAARGLERVPGLTERTVRNVNLRAGGRFDDVLRVTRDIAFPVHDPQLGTIIEVIPAGTLLMADLKTKRRKFFSHLEVRIQLAVYATAEWMLSEGPDPHYLPGPAHHVDQNWGVVLHMPSSGANEQEGLAGAQLKRVNLIKGYEHALLARAVVDARSEAKNVAAHDESDWPVEL